MTKNKKVWTSLLTLILAFFAIGAIAITKEVMKKETVNQVKVEPAKKLVFETWYFTAEYSDDPMDPRNYSLDPLHGKPCVTPLQTVCQIKAPTNPLNDEQPDLEAVAGSSTVEQEIQDALNSLSGPNPTTNSTVIAFRAK